MRVQISVVGSLARTAKRALKSRTQAANAIAQAWKAAVMRSRLSARAKRRYANAIVPYASKPGAYVKDKIAALLEKGWRAFDMKPGLLRGKLSRVIPLQLPSGTEFRTVSRSSPAGSWQHPGYKGAQVVPDLKNRLQDIVSKAMK